MQNRPKKIILKQNFWNFFYLNYRLMSNVELVFKVCYLFGIKTQQMPPNGVYFLKFS